MVTPGRALSLNQVSRKLGPAAPNRPDRCLLSATVPAVPRQGACCFTGSTSLPVCSVRRARHQLEWWNDDWLGSTTLVIGLQQIKPLSTPEIGLNFNPNWQACSKLVKPYNNQCKLVRSAQTIRDLSCLVYFVLLLLLFQSGLRHKFWATHYNDWSTVWLRVNGWPGLVGGTTGRNPLGDLAPHYLVMHNIGTTTTFFLPPPAWSTRPFQVPQPLKRIGRSKQQLNSQFLPNKNIL